MTRAPSDDIQAPGFPPRANWINSSQVRMHEQRGHPVLVEFWDFCRPNSVRTLPYLQAWHERYAESGLLVIGVHAAGFPPGADADAVRDAVARLGIEYPVVIDAALDVWRDYDNLGWPARYLFGPDNMLYEYHFGEGAYVETEAAIQTLLGVSEPLLAPVRPEDHPQAMIAIQTDDQPGPYSGPYEAGEVWAVLSGAGIVRAEVAASGDGEREPGRVEVAVTHPGAYRLIHHEVSTAGKLALEVGDGVECHAVCFTPGLAG